MTKIQVKRVYSDPDSSREEDGYRVYADRLWPRGESKEKFHYDLWAKDIAPSTELREWFHQDPANRWDEFKKRYIAELNENPEVETLVKHLSEYPLVTLLFSSRNTAENNADVLADYLSERLA